MQNPYRTDIPGRAPFVGREDEITRLVGAIEAGRDSLAAVMGGRGIGKTSLALQVIDRLRSCENMRVRLVRRPAAEPMAFLEQLGTELGHALDPKLPTDSIVDTVETLESDRVAILIDEIEQLLATDPGRVLLDNLRIAWEALDGKLAIVIFGGSKLHLLLQSDTSSFLRSAQWFPLRGLSLQESAQLLSEPAGLEIPAPLLEALWEQTCGHPLLLQAIMAHALPLDPAVIPRLPESIEHIAQTRLRPILFPIWWDNLGQRGQALYRTLVKHPGPVHRQSWLPVLGSEPEPWIEILETTGVARVESEELLPRGELFRRWVTENHPLEPGVLSSDPSGPELDMHPFETATVEATTRWVRDMLEYPALALKSSSDRGNDRLQVEQHFQLLLLLALRQRGLLVEPEPLSSQQGRTDLKLRWPDDTDRRACTELKIWGRNDYKQVIDQLLGYAIPEDQFGCVIMIDRQARPLHPAYYDVVLGSGTKGAVLWPPGGHEPDSLYPAFVTEHHRSAGGPLRIHHFLLQLPSD